MMSPRTNVPRTDVHGTQLSQGCESVEVPAHLSVAQRELLQLKAGSQVQEVTRNRRVLKDECFELGECTDAGETSYNWCVREVEVVQTDHALEVRQVATNLSASVERRYKRAWKNRDETEAGFWKRGVQT